MRWRDPLLIRGSGRNAAQFVRGGEMLRTYVSPTGWLIALCAVGLACPKVPPEPTEEGAVRVHRILEQQEDKDDLTRFAGRDPSVCVTSTATAELASQWVKLASCNQGLIVCLVGAAAGHWGAHRSVACARPKTRRAGRRTLAGPQC